MDIDYVQLLFWILGITVGIIAFLLAHFFYSFNKRLDTQEHDIGVLKQKIPKIETEIEYCKKGIDKFESSTNDLWKEIKNYSVQRKDIQDVIDELNGANEVMKEALLIIKKEKGNLNEINRY
jgi:peptidoglycan hydrolase CwlO-like protein